MFFVTLPGLPGVLKQWRDRWLPAVVPPQGHWLSYVTLCAMTVPVSVVVGFFVGRVMQTRKLRRAAEVERARNRYTDWMGAIYVVGQFIRPAFERDGELERAGVLMSVEQDILRAFASTCPQGKISGGVKGEAATKYDQFLLHQWLSYNGACLLVQERAEFHWPPRDAGKSD